MPKLVDHAERREELLAATWRVIAGPGLDAATTRRIAEESGWSTGVLAHYFGSKDDILRSALELACARQHARGKRRLEEASGLAALRPLLREALPLDEERRLELQVEVAFWGRMIAQGRDPAERHGDELQRSEYVYWQEVLRSVLADARHAGEIDPKLDLERVAVLLVAFLDGLTMQALLLPDLFPPDRQLALLEAELELLGL